MAFFLDGEQLTIDSWGVKEPVNIVSVNHVHSAGKKLYYHYAGCTAFLSQVSKPNLFQLTVVQNCNMCVEFFDFGQFRSCLTRSQLISCKVPLCLKAEHWDCSKDVLG